MAQRYRQRAEPPYPKWDRPQQVRKAKQPPPIPQWDPPIQLTRRPNRKPVQFLGLWISALGAVLLAIGIGFGAGWAGDDSRSTATPVPAVAVTESANPQIQGGDAPTDKTTKKRQNPTKAAYNPKPQDIETKVEIRHKECLDSARCTITFRIATSYVGDQSAPADGVTKVTYTVSGGVPTITNTLQFRSDGTVPYNSDIVETPSPSQELTAKVTKVTYDRFG